MKIAFDVRTLADSLYWIPLLPLLGAFVLGVFGKWLSKQSVAIIACSTVGGSAVLAAMVLLPMAFPVLFAAEPARSISDILGVWFSAGGLTVTASFFVDHLNAILAMVVSGVGFLIHVYSVEYMREDEGFARFFAYLNLFVGFMLILVLANSLVLLFVGWEGVGLCSYLLIGFWYEDDQKAYAGRKAFVVNRIGDFGFLLGMFTLFALFGTLDVFTLPGSAAGATLFDGVRQLASGGFDPSAAVRTGPLGALGFTWGQGITLACLLLFVGAAGKSAQFPLYVWLPDAMAGPTPVSALIHAATMVTAGVYMIARLSFLFALSPTAMAVVTLIGAFTALFAALMGFAQNDIKKVLAYSTVSQLGFMIIGVGIGAWWQGTFHLVTHAFFKACLFLGAGSVILGCHHEHDIRRMGGLRRKMPHTAFTFLVATLAITGVAPLSGFFSKDAILHFAHGAQLAGFGWVGPTAYYLGTAAALGTAFYMFRLYFLVFEGEPRSHDAEHAHEQSGLITFPLWVLAVFSVVGLVWGWPWKPFALPGAEGLEPIFRNFTAPAFALGNRLLGAAPEHGGLLVAFLVALAVAWVGFAAAWWLYRRDGIKALAPAFQRGPGRLVYELVANKFYVDEIYDRLIVTPFKALSFLLWQVVDVMAIDRIAVRGTAQVTGWVGAMLRYAQNGDVQRYAAVMLIAAVLVIWAAMAL